MFLKTLGNAIGEVAVGTVGVVGSTAGGAVCGASGLISGTLKGDPLGGLERGVNNGIKHGGDAGRITGNAAIGAVGMVGKTLLKVEGAAVETATLAANTASRGVEAVCRGGFLDGRQSDAARLSAFLAADVYEICRRGESKWTTRSVRINSATYGVKLQQWKPGNNLRVAVYKVITVSGSSDGSLGPKDIVLSFKGTDFSTEPVMDSMDDISIFLGIYNTVRTMQHKHDSMEGMWKCPRELKSKFGASRLYVTGHSLGGAAATIYSSHDDNFDYIAEANVFNPGTGITQNDCDAANVGDWIREFALTRPMFRAASLAGVGGAAVKIQVHHIYGDIISALATGSDIVAVTTYRKYAETSSPHAVANFTSAQMDGLLKE